MNEVRERILERLTYMDAKEAIFLERSNQRICLSSGDGSAWRRRRLSALVDRVIRHVAAYEGWRSVIAVTDCLSALHDDADGMFDELEVHWFDQTGCPMFAALIEDAWAYETEGHGTVVHFCDGSRIAMDND
jgi:hypothetical protein